MGIDDELKDKIIHNLNNIELSEICFGCAEPLPDFKVTSSIPSPRIIMTLSGKRHYCFSNGSKIVYKPLKSNAVLVLPPYAWTDVDNPKISDSHTLSIVFRDDCIRFVEVKIHKHRRDLNIIHTVNPPSNAIAYSLKALISLANHSAMNEMLSLAKVILSLCYKELMIDINIQKRTSSTFLLKRIKQFVDENLHKPIDRQIIADEFSINANYVSQIFGQSNEKLSDYIVTQRMDKASYFLTMTNLTINEIAHKCGYSQTNYFITVFKSKFMCTPLEYRKKMLYLK